MPAPGQSWPLDFKVISCVFHSIAIGSGIFRASYRWSISRFAWEDSWASLSLVADVGCLICVWLQQPSPQLSNTDIILNFVSTVTLTSVPWAARLSMITTIIRIADPRAGIRHMSYAIAVSFGLMWMALLAQKLYVCSVNSCDMTHAVAISQLTTDVVSDVLLVIMPILFLRGMKIRRSHRLLLVLSFASSICISIVSIVHSVSLFMPLSGFRLLLVQLKAALATLICNLLVIMTFTYRLCKKMDIDPGIPTKSEHVEFTSIILDQSTSENFPYLTPPKPLLHHSPHTPTSLLLEQSSELSDWKDFAQMRG